MKINNLRSLVAAATCALLLCQCATNHVPQLNPGEAHFNAFPSKKHRGELAGMRIVSVNGKKEGSRAARIPSGPVDVVVALHWPKVGKVKVPLHFNAQNGHAYFVKYDRYPHPGSSKRYSSRVPKGRSLAASHLSSEGLFPGIVLIPVVAVTIVISAATYIYQGVVNHGVDLGPRSRQAANYIDMSVISTLSSEGVVQQVRAYPSGRVDKR